MRYISTASTEPIVCDVAAIQGGATINPTSDSVSFAFLAVQDDTPESGDWHSGTWDTDTEPTPDRYAAVIAVGPNGVVLAAGTWWVWVKVAHSPYTIVRAVGSIVVR